MRRNCLLSHILRCTEYIRAIRSGGGPRNFSVPFYHHQSQEPKEEFLPSEWYRSAFPKLVKLSNKLRNVDLIDGRLVNFDDDSTVIDDSLKHKIQKFRSVARVFIGSPTMQKALKEKVVPKSCFRSSSERKPITLNTLTKVSSILNLLPHQRRLVRTVICEQVTEHRIWTGTLEEILKELKTEMELMNDHRPPTKASHIGLQIISNCLRFLDDTRIKFDPDSISWMRPMPTKNADFTPPQHWKDLLEMFNDFSKCLDNEKGFLYHASKLEGMKEGLHNIKDILVDRGIGYKEARHQESLVKKRLIKSLGHSSQCFFTLLQYYFYGNVRDIQVEVHGGLYRGGKKKFYLCMGKILTSVEEKVLWCGVKQLDRALGIFKLVWETVGTKEVLELQGHLWCIGAEEKTLSYRGNEFFLHEIRL
ncbi:hypothetical protein GIB67_017106 [Kingdonia uniflora]|uniref:Uncharacterized protein n=1 Tax=Kingdonia uniflora TaxID=39325 RepID=A0A7J7NCV0_9MAGN|nr:hypothetical protein GIB67_017106 [Kingdonia uniflora]